MTKAILYPWYQAPWEERRRLKRILCLHLVYLSSAQPRKEKKKNEENTMLTFSSVQLNHMASNGLHDIKSNHIHKNYWIFSMVGFSNKSKKSFYITSLLFILAENWCRV